MNVHARRVTAKAVLLCLAGLPSWSFAAAATCPDDGIACGHKCIPLGSSCCDSRGDYCGKGLSCATNGCVPAGGPPCGDHYCRKGLICLEGKDCVPQGSVECGRGSGVYCPQGHFCPDSRLQFSSSTSVEAGLEGVRFGQSLLEVERRYPGGVTTTRRDNVGRSTTTYQLRIGWADFPAVIVRFEFMASELRHVQLNLPRRTGSIPESEGEMKHARKVLTARYGAPDATSDIGGAYWGFTNSIIILERQTNTPGVVAPSVTFHAAIRGLSTCIPDYLLLRSPEIRRLEHRLDGDAGATAVAADGDGGPSPDQVAWPCALATSAGDDLLPDSALGHYFAWGSPLSKVKELYPGGQGGGSGAPDYEVRLSALAGRWGAARFSFDEKGGLRQVAVSFWKSDSPTATQAALHQALRCVLTKKLGAPDPGHSAEQWTGAGGGFVSLEEDANATWRVRFASQGGGEGVPAGR